MTHTNKTIMLGGAVALAAAAVLLLPGGEDITPVPSASKALLEAPASSHQKTTLLFEAVPSKRGADVIKAPLHSRNEPGKNNMSNEKPLPLGASAIDVSKTYEIAVYDPEQIYKPSQAPQAHHYAILQGTVDGKRFSLRVPDTVLQHPESTLLRIQNRRTGEVSTASAAGFIEAMNASANTNKRSEFSIDSTEPGNFSEKRVSLITPPAPK